MKNSLMYPLGGIAIGCFILVSFFAGSFDSIDGIPLVGAVGAQEIQKGLILGLVIVVLARLGTRDVRRDPCHHSLIESHRQGRVRRLRRITAQRFN